MAQITTILHEAMAAGAVGWSAQRLMADSALSIQRDYDGTPMVSDLLPDEFYLALAQALRDEGKGCMQGRSRYRTSLSGHREWSRARPAPRRRKYRQKEVL